MPNSKSTYGQDTRAPFCEVQVPGSAVGHAAAAARHTQGTVARLLFSRRIGRHPTLLCRHLVGWCTFATYYRVLLQC